MEIMHIMSYSDMISSCCHYQQQLNNSSSSYITNIHTCIIHTYKLHIISMMHLSISHYLSLTTYLSPLPIHVSRCTTARKVSQVQLFGLTAPLMTTSDGKKMGKTASGAVWLNKDLLSEYDYWQFWRNTADADVIRQATFFIVLY